MVQASRMHWYPILSLAASGLIEVSSSSRADERMLKPHASSWFDHVCLPRRDRDMKGASEAVPASNSEVASVNTRISMTKSGAQCP